MSKVNVVIVALCSFAVGVGVALLVASLASESMQQIKQERSRIAIENQELKRRIAEEGGGNREDSQRRHLRPGRLGAARASAWILWPRLALAEFSV